MYHPLTQEEIRSRLTIPTGKLRLVIDTDAKNEVDDQFAIAWALRSKERFSVEAVYAAPFSHTAPLPWVRARRARWPGPCTAPRTDRPTVWNRAIRRSSNSFPC